jgi:hypothetical protein
VLRTPKGPTSNIPMGAICRRVNATIVVNVTKPVSMRVERETPLRIIGAFAESSRARRGQREPPPWMVAGSALLTAKAACHDSLVLGHLRLPKTIVVSMHKKHRCMWTATTSCKPE